MSEKVAEAVISAKSIQAQQERIRGALRLLLKDPADSTQSEEGPYVYIRDWLTDNSVVYEYQGKVFRISWAEVDDAVTFGTPEEVEQVYATREADLDFAPVSLVEAKVRRDGTLPVKVIQPGWGSSGYYSAEVLESSAEVFEGVQMFWDHPTKSDQQELPERSLDRLAGVLSNVRFMENGPDGAGLYGSAKPFSPYKDRLEEMAPHIGLSILASGRLREGEAEGKKGPIVEAITKARSVDFVTMAGAGGKVMSLFESLREGELEESKEVNEGMADATELQEALSTAQTELREAREENERLQQENARYREADIVREATLVVTEAIKDAQVPDLTKARITESLSKNPPVKDGALDKDALTTAVEEAIKVEAEYLAKVVGSGKVKGLGESRTEDEAEGPDIKESEEALGEAFSRIGLAESEAKTATQGR